MEPTPWDPEGLPVYLDANGRLRDPSGKPTPKPSVGTATPVLAPIEGLDVRGAYKRMVAIRCLDARLARIGAPMWALQAGEEAAPSLLPLLVDDGDVLAPGPRDWSWAWARGLELDEVVRQLLGAAPKQARARIGAGVSALARDILPATESLGLHLALAAGAAHAQRRARSGAITLATFGEGASTCGVVYEALTVAARLDLPFVAVCRSRLWPDEVPPEAGLVGEVVATRAAAVGLESVRVDGADLVAVYVALSRAIERAREGRGAGLVEIVTTPIRDETPAHRDPIERVRLYLDAAGQWTQTFHDVVEAEARGTFDKVLAQIEADPPLGEGAR